MQAGPTLSHQKNEFGNESSTFDASLGLFRGHLTI